MDNPPKSTLTIESKKWYYYLNPKEDKSGKALFSDYPSSSIYNKLIVSLNYLQNKKELRLFTLFDSYIDFGIYQNKFKPESRCFFEEIFGHLSQKPRFDLDIDTLEFPKLDSESLKDSLLDSIIQVLSQKDIHLNLNTDLILCTSHKPEKKSYHIIINNYCHLNNLEAKAFYDLVIEDLLPKLNLQKSILTKIIDQSVYKSKQQFRIVGSQKLNSNRPKILNEQWSHHNQKIQYKYIEPPEDDGHKMMLQLEATLLSCTSNCKILPSFLPPAPPETISYQESENISKDIGIQALKLCASIAGLTINDPIFPYRFDTIKGPLVLLKRIRPSKCRICHRIHEHENPYLMIIGNEQTVYFHCRRASPDQKLYIGKLNPLSKQWIQQVLSTMDNINQSVLQIQESASQIMEQVDPIAETSTGSSSLKEYNPRHLASSRSQRFKPSKWRQPRY